MATADDIRRFYERILQRSGAEVSQAEIDFWAAQADAGSLAAARDAIVASAEASRFVDPVARMYQAAFGRLPDPGGLDSLADSHRSGAATARDLANAFAGSIEFQGTYGNSPAPTDAYIAALYGNALGRAPDETGHDDDFELGAKPRHQWRGVLLLVRLDSA